MQEVDSVLYRGNAFQTHWVFCKPKPLAPACWHLPLRIERDDPLNPQATSPKALTSSGPVKQRAIPMIHRCRHLLSISAPTSKTAFLYEFRS
jgi:hypothetical protein